MRDYRSSTPWATTQGQDPTGGGLARTEPARAAGLVPDLLVPLGQAVVTGALGAGLVVFAISELAPNWDGSGLKAWAGLGLAIAAVAWGVLLGQTRRLLWAIETRTGLDLDRDGATGRPGVDRLLVLNGAKLKKDKEDQQRQQATAEFQAFLKLLPIQGTSLRVWAPDIGRAQYIEYRDWLLDHGLARWNSYREDGTPNETQGWTLTTPVDTICKALD